MESLAGWSLRANCANTDLLLFFATKGQRSTSAKRLCNACLVVTNCYNYAVVHGEKGVWGNSTEDERETVPPYIKDWLTSQFELAGILESRDYDYGPATVEQRLQSSSVYELVDDAADIIGREIELLLKELSA